MELSLQRRVALNFKETYANLIEVILAAMRTGHAYL